MIFPMVLTVINLEVPFLASETGFEFMNFIFKGI